MPREPGKRKSVRLPEYDYTTPGAYLVTICTQNHICLFGRIETDKVILSELGLIAEKYWKKIPEHFKNVKLDEYIVMPDHIHGILILSEDRRDTACRVPTYERFSRPVPGSLSTIIRSFKSSFTGHVNKLHSTPGRKIWQGRYYEHVIRNPNDLKGIREYIINNPTRRSFDRENLNK